MPLASSGMGKDVTFQAEGTQNKFPGKRLGNSTDAMEGENRVDKRIQVNAKRDGGENRVRKEDIDRAERDAFSNMCENYFKQDRTE
jgi:hypothetical protein